jgi:hypothetical protein
MRVPKKSKQRRKQGVTAAGVARLAGCSHVLAGRLLKRGLTPDEIIERIKENKVREANRAASNGSPSPPLDLPVVPITSNGSLYAYHQARKEEALADFRRIQVMEKQRELIPVSYVRRWASEFLIQGRQILEWGPSELQDELAMESDPLKVRAILDAWVARVMERFSRLTSLYEPPFAGDDQPKVA